VAAREAPTRQTSISVDGPVLSSLAGQSEKLDAIVGKFAARLESKLSDMDASCAAGDFEELAALAHWLKGSAGMVGFSVFTEPARQLEELAIERKATEIDASLSELRSLAERIELPEKGQG